MGRPLRRVPGLGHRRGAVRPAQPRAGGTGHGTGAPDRRGADRGLAGPQQRGARARPGAGRRARAGRRDPAGRRARRRQVDAAARGGGPDRPAAPPRPLRHRRGVRRPGADARRPHRRHLPRALPRRRDRPRCRARPRRGGQAHPAGHRLGADHQRRRRRRCPGRGHAGQGGLGRADPDGQAAQHHAGDHRPRDQGRVDRRPPGAGAPGRRRAAVRGRAHQPAADGAGGEEPLRPRRRGGVLRPLGRRHRGHHRPDRAVPRRAPRPRPGDLRGGEHGGTPADAERGAGPGHPQPPRAPPPHLLGRRPGPGRDDPRGAAAARRDPAAQPRRLRLQRGRRPAHRAEQRRGDHARDRLGLPRSPAGSRHRRHGRARPVRRAASRPRPRRPAGRGRPDGVPLGVHARGRPGQRRAEQGDGRAAGDRGRPRAPRAGPPRPRAGGPRPGTPVGTTGAPSRCTRLRPWLPPTVPSDRTMPLACGPPSR